MEMQSLENKISVQQKEITEANEQLEKRMQQLQDVSFDS